MGVVCCLVPADGELTSPGRQADRKDGSIDMVLVFEKVLQECRSAAFGPLVGRREPHDAVCTLRVEELVLIGVAAKIGVHWRVLVEGVAQLHGVVEPEARDGAALGVRLPVGAVPVDAALSAVTAAVEQSRGLRAGEVEDRV
eukprot:CAMPEP_0168423370 /NCGR_PEP_ID=MMETSP0228-20121227/34273_1 /TAXON_ID=133427 /ORGANISM="Protoceratium reticulatum, Strain CCCM 535 (=CCMP 1889)" /LENGTH=141 /DNA_ID=CAMNT_0008437329 /DNA_START=868 /DNA_END=1293 /DNA_ORIENTATION=+